MKIPEQQIEEACRIWGYTPKEARFLWIVTAFGGHFIRAQYRRHTDTARGREDQALCEKLLGHGHVAGAYPWGNQQRTDRYHVYGRPLYRVFGRENSSNRKAPASNSTIAVRVATLDFVLGEQDADYLLTDSDRIAFLRDVHGIADTSLIPTRIYPPRGRGSATPEARVLFPDRFPMSVAADGTVTFSFVDAPEDSLQPFETHLARYAPLADALKGPVRVVFVSGVASKLARAETAFRRVWGSPGEEISAELLRYFELEDRFLRKDYVGLRKRDYDERADLAKRFAGEQNRKLFDRWRSGGVARRIEGDLPAVPPAFSAVRAGSLDA
jgi:hypothetical protein